MRASSYFRQSDPALNRQFSRVWEMPPDPGRLKRERAPAATRKPDLKLNSNETSIIETALKAQAERWLVQRNRAATTESAQ